MEKREILYGGILLAGVFISAVSQILLKKSALRRYASPWQEYLNPLVVAAYALFVGATFLSILAYRVIPLSLGPILEATSYLYVTIFGVVLFQEKLNRTKLLALVLIIAGILIFSVSA